MFSSKYIEKCFEEKNILPIVLFVCCDQKGYFKENYNYTNLLNEAAKLNNVNLMRLFLFAGHYKLLPAKKNNARSPLFYVVENGSRVMFDLLLRNKSMERFIDKSHLFGADADGNSALIMAIHKNDLWMIRSLLECGYPYYKDKYQRNALYYAAANGNVKIIRMLKYHYLGSRYISSEKLIESDVNGTNSLMIAAANNNVDVIEQLILDFPELILYETNYGDTVMHMGAHNLRLLDLLVRKFIQYYGDKNLNYAFRANRVGITPFHTALSLEKYEVAEFILFKTGRHVLIPTENGYSPLNDKRHVVQEMINRRFNNMFSKPYKN